MTPRRMGWIGAVVSFAICFATSSMLTSAALLEDVDNNPANVIASATRLTEVPAECAHMTFDNVIVGTDDDDLLTGDNGRRDLIFGLAGNDEIYGDSQDDCLVGGSGNDTLMGQEGQDVLLGGSQNDDLNGNQGQDVLIGGSGDDELIGDNAQDELLGGDGLDTCSGGHAPDGVNCDVVVP